MGDEAEEVGTVQTVLTLQAFVSTFVFQEKWNPLDSAGRVMGPDLVFEDLSSKLKLLRKDCGEQCQTQYRRCTQIRMIAVDVLRSS